jgi:hypothetical protein
LQGCASGQELIQKGFAADVALIAALDAEDCAPMFEGGSYTKAE